MIRQKSLKYVKIETEETKCLPNCLIFKVLASGHLGSSLVTVLFFKLSPFQQNSVGPGGAGGGLGTPHCESQTVE